MACDTFASKAKHRITIKKPVLTSSDMGGQTSTFETLATVWAILEPKSGREFFAQGSLQSRTTHHATIRYRSDMANIRENSNYVVEYKGRSFGIINVMNLDEAMKYEGDDFQKIILEENSADIYG